MQAELDVCARPPLPCTGAVARYVGRTPRVHPKALAKPRTSSCDREGHALTCVERVLLRHAPAPTHCENNLSCWPEIEIDFD